MFIEKFRKTASRRNSSSKDRQLLERLLTLTADLPELYARKERERQRRWTLYEPKRASTRLEAKRQQRLELEEITQEQKARHEKFLEYKRRQEDVITKERERLERNERVRRREGTREVIRMGTETLFLFRTGRSYSSPCGSGIVHHSRCFRIIRE